MAFTFKGGIFLSSKQNEQPLKMESENPTEHLKITFSNDENALFTPFTCIGAKVKPGSLLLENEKNERFFSPVSGKVVGFTHTEIEIENDFLDFGAEEPHAFEKSLKETSKEEIIAFLRSMGLSSLGGFSLEVPLDSPPSVLLVNALEDHPYLKSKSSLCYTYPSEIISGLKIIMKALSSVSSVFILNKRDPETLKALTSEPFPREILRFFLLEPKYPGGDEEFLYAALQRKYLKKGESLKDKNIAVISPKDCFDVYRMFAKQFSPSDCAVTVAGSLLPYERTVLVPVGTSVKDLLLDSSADLSAPSTLIVGRKGHYEECSVDSYIEEGTSLLLLMKKEEELLKKGKCTRCGKCADACPIGLLPYKFYLFSTENKKKEFQKAYPDYCIQCGVCDEICPENLPVLEMLQDGLKKWEIGKEQIENKETFQNEPIKTEEEVEEPKEISKEELPFDKKDAPIIKEDSSSLDEPDSEKEVTMEEVEESFKNLKASVQTDDEREEKDAFKKENIPENDLNRESEAEEQP